MSRLLTRASVLYLVAVLAVVGYGLYGYSLPPAEGSFTELAALPVYQDYRQFLSWTTKALGLGLGALAAAFGLWAGSGQRASMKVTLTASLGALLAGLLISGAAMLPLPLVIVPDESYHAWFLWLIAPYWLISWAIVIIPGLIISRLRSKGA